MPAERPAEPPAEPPDEPPAMAARSCGRRRETGSSVNLDGGGSMVRCCKVECCWERRAALSQTTRSRTGGRRVRFVLQWMPSMQQNVPCGDPGGYAGVVVVRKNNNSFLIS